MNYFSQVVRKRLGKVKIQDMIQDIGLNYNLWLHHYNRGSIKREYVHKILDILQLPYQVVFPLEFKQENIQAIERLKEGKNADSRQPGVIMMDGSTPEEDKKEVIKEGSFADVMKKAIDKAKSNPESDRPKSQEKPKEKETETEEEQIDLLKLKFAD